LLLKPAQAGQPRTFLFQSEFASLDLSVSRDMSYFGFLEKSEINVERISCFVLEGAAQLKRLAASAFAVAADP